MKNNAENFFKGKYFMFPDDGSDVTDGEYLFTEPFKEVNRYKYLIGSYFYVPENATDVEGEDNYFKFWIDKRELTFDCYIFKSASNISREFRGNLVYGKNFTLFIKKRITVPYETEYDKRFIYNMPVEVTKETFLEEVTLSLALAYVCNNTILHKISNEFGIKIDENEIVNKIDDICKYKKKI